MSEEFLLERRVGLLTFEKTEKSKALIYSAGRKTLNYPNTQMTLVLCDPTLRTYTHFLINFQNTKKLQDVSLTPIEQKDC